jgi:hypothetical protein
LFVNYKVEDLKSGKVSLHEEEHKENVKLIIDFFENEHFNIKNWKFYEMHRTEEYYVYGFENKNDLFCITVTSKGEVTPNYFKNHDFNKYSLFEADSINDAIKLFENYYEPKNNGKSENQ